VDECKPLGAGNAALEVDASTHQHDALAAGAYSRPLFSST